MANLFSFSRFFLGILFIFLILNGQQIAGISILFIAVITDFFDGFIARKLNQVSDFGALLDPIADRFLVLCVGATLLVQFWQPIYKWTALLLIARELLIALGFLWLKRKNILIKVSMLGKVTTAFVFTAFVVTFILPKQGIYLLLPAVMLYFLSALNYLTQAWRQIAKKN